MIAALVAYFDRDHVQIRAQIEFEKTRRFAGLHLAVRNDATTCAPRKIRSR